MMLLECIKECMGIGSEVHWWNERKTTLFVGVLFLVMFVLAD